MFARVLALLPLALLVSASHLEARGQCNTGSIQCCDTVQTYAEAQNLLGQHGAQVKSEQMNQFVGSSCQSYMLVGTNSGCQASQQPLCCTGNTQDGLVNFGCTPVNLAA